VSIWREAGPDRRRDAVWTLVAALAGLGVVVNAAAPRMALSPVIATAMNVRWIGTRAVLVAVAATVVGLVLLRWWPWLLLALLVATVTATVAAAAPAVAGRGGLAAILGPVVGALVIGGKQSLIVTQLGDGGPLSSYLVGADHLRLSAGLLVAAALAVIGLGVAESLRGRLHGPPAATAGTGPVGQRP
jgi:hypothetical protein